MDLLMFFIGLAAMVVLLWLGYFKSGFAFAYVGMFIAILLGIFLFQTGLDIQTGTTVVASGEDFIISDAYTNHSVANDGLINLIANLFLYGGVVGIIMTTFIALRS